MLESFVEQDGLRDVYVDGIARIEPIGDGLLVRVWLYSEEHLAIPMKVIRARLVLPLDRALELNGEAGKTYRQIHRAFNPLKGVG